MGVYVRVEGDGTAVWAGCTLEVTNASGNETWTYNTQFALPRASSWDVVDDFVTWHNSASRVWTGAATASWVKGTTPATGRVEFALSSTLSTTWNGSADMLTLMDWTNATATSIGNGTIGGIGSVDVQMSVRNFIERLPEDGVWSASNAWTNGSGQFASRRPSVTGYMTELEALALSDGLRIAANPRQVVVYESHGAAYRVLDMGEIALTRGRQLYSVDMQGVG